MPIVFILEFKLLISSEILFAATVGRAIGGICCCGILAVETLICALVNDDDDSLRIDLLVPELVRDVCSVACACSVNLTIPSCR